MAVKRGPWSVLAGKDHADIANALLDLAAEAKDDHTVTGVVVILQRRQDSKRDLEVLRAGSLRRSAASVVYALTRVVQSFM